MVQLTIKTREGEIHRIESPAGATLQEAARSAGIDELLALCGGCCSCATCHVYLAPEWFARLAGPSDNEDALLDSSDHRSGNSRLACQIVLTQELDGLTVQIAPED